MQKPNIFIGSSTEGQMTAKKVKRSLGAVAACHIWHDNFFELNVATVDNLCKKLIGYDFAVFIGSKDDQLYSRGEGFASIRDNVLFEYGLFTGLLGRQRTFLLE